MRKRVWKFENQMTFLNPFLQSREQISNLPSSQENVETLSNIVEESENEAASVAHSSLAAESASFSSRSETPHQISGDGKKLQHVKENARDTIKAQHLPLPEF
jgi:hypothetical protein